MYIQHRINLYTILFSYIFLGACTSYHLDIKSSVLTYRGTVTEESAEELFIKVGTQKIRKIIITSKGGDVQATIKIADWIYRNQINVEIDEYCLSSCANYIFPAGDRKIIRDGAIVAWHGNVKHLLRPENLNKKKLTIKDKDWIEMILFNEEAFFKRINVNELVCRIGKLEPYKAYNLYFLSVNDMKKFNIQNVKAPDNYIHTNLARFNSYSSPDKLMIEYVSLQEEF